MTAAHSAEPLTLTIVLKRDDEAGFQQFLHDLYDPASPAFRHFLSQAQIAERFGPSQESYDAVLAYLRGRNFSLLQDSVNRMTLTVSATRADVENALAVHIGDFTLGQRSFYANKDEPALPGDIGSHVSAVLGLSNLARSERIGALTEQEPEPEPPQENEPDYYEFLALSCKLGEKIDPIDTGTTIASAGSGVETGATGLALSFTATFLHYQCAADELNLVAEYAASAGGERPAVAGKGPVASVAAGSGQKIGLAEFDSYNRSDIFNFFNLIGHPDRVAQLSDRGIGAGADFTIEGESEVLLDIDTVLALAPGASVVVYNAGFRGQGSFQTMFNTMLGDGVNVISNSWAYCENQTTLADVQSLDALLQMAALGGVTVVTGAGDSGSTCLDGSANTVAVPAGSPNITSVGGTSATPGLEGTYGSETWWDGTQQIPSTGQGGFGISRFFTRPGYQNSLNAQAMRSVPDVSAPADPTQGVFICQADNGGCPSNLLYGGTSIAAPIWAASVAVLNQTMATQLGFLNPQLYPLANGSAFHSAASMGSDFAHVGLGSPNFGELRRLLAHANVGAVSTAGSALVAFPARVPADGKNAAGVAVVLLDATFNTVSGQAVTLSAAGSSAVITAVNSTSNVANGAARFKVTDSVVETVTLTAAAGTGNLVQTAQINFVGPAATNGGIVASPTTQTADGSSASIVTVTLDALATPAAGKRVLLSQNASSVIIGENPATTDVTGKVQFSVTDQVQETAVYTAIDVTDDNLPVPQTASVTFVGGPGGGCGNPGTPVAGPGYAISTYASGFPVQNGVLFGGIDLLGCVGVGGIAFDSAGNLFASDYVTGDVYKIPPGGGGGPGNLITPKPLGASLGGLTFGLDGTLYATRVATADIPASSGAVLKIDTTNGTAMTVASGIACPSNITTNPLPSGDLFVSDFCYGSAQESDIIWRIANPSGASPAVSQYAESGIAPNGSVSFAPDGTLYAVYGYTNFDGLFSGIDRISGTTGPMTPTVQATGVSSSFSALALGTNASGGGAQSLVVGAQSNGGFAHSVAVFDMTTPTPVFSGTTLVESDIGSTKILGPDQCLYLANSNVIYRLTNADGSCPLAGLAPNPSIVLNPETEPAIAAQGSPLRFDVSFPHNPDLPLGTQITYLVSGANPKLGTVNIGFGNVVITYSGEQAGNDSIVAFAQINGATVTSNPVPVTWTPGKHTTYIDLNSSASSGTLGSSAAVSAMLIDTSVEPAVAIAGALIQFTVAGQSCNATTDAAGNATCSLAVSALTQCTLTASYAGSSQYVAATASELFAVSSVDVVFANGFEPQQEPGCVIY